MPPLGSIRRRPQLRLRFQPSGTRDTLPRLQGKKGAPSPQEIA
jgi:hypothetical protein